MGCWGLGFRQCLWCVWGFLGCGCGVFGVSLVVLRHYVVYAYGLGMMAYVVVFATMFKGV